MKIRSFAILSMLAVALSIFAAYRTFTNTQLVYVDINKLIEGYHKTKQAKIAFEKKADIMKANVDSLLTSWEKELKDFEKERSTLTANELQLKQQLLSNKQQQVNNYQQSVQEQMQSEDKKVTEMVLTEINAYVKEYGKKSGYNIIFGANGAGNIMYADETTDLTEDVLQGLNKDYEK